jgi:predicted RNA binding protein YcfA (HicA-like mRNA interferase family)
MSATPEGRILTRIHRVRERNRALVEKKKQQVLKSEGRLACEGCGFDFACTYGEHATASSSAITPFRSRRCESRTKLVEVRKALLDAGWRVVLQAGSHEVWAHAEHEARIVVAGKDRDTVPVGTLGSIRRASGLEHLR